MSVSFRGYMGNLCKETQEDHQTNPLIWDDNSLTPLYAAKRNLSCKTGYSQSDWGLCPTNPQMTNKRHFLLIHRDKINVIKEIRRVVTTLSWLQVASLKERNTGILLDCLGPEISPLYRLKFRSHDSDRHWGGRPLIVLGPWKVSSLPRIFGCRYGVLLYRW